MSVDGTNSAGPKGKQSGILFNFHLREIDAQ